MFFWEKSTALSLTQSSNVRGTQGLISGTLVSACLRTHVFVSLCARRTFRHGGESKKKAKAISLRRERNAIIKVNPRSCWSSPCSASMSSNKLSDLARHSVAPSQVVVSDESAKGARRKQNKKGFHNPTGISVKHCQACVNY